MFFRRRLFKYVVPVILISIVINIPKFLESKVVSKYIDATTSTGNLSTAATILGNQNASLPTFNNSKR